MPSIDIDKYPKIAQMHPTVSFILLKSLFKINFNTSII